jgi:hypothetical protein
MKKGLRGVQGSGEAFYGFPLEIPQKSLELFEVAMPSGAQGEASKPQQHVTFIP